MDFNVAIDAFQTLLQQGYTSISLGGLPWLNNVCAELTIICKYLHTFLISDCKSNENAIHSSFLCMNQMICCIKYLEKILKKEKHIGIVLSPTRQHFLDRLVWCVARLKEIVRDSNVQTSTEPTNEMEPSFVGYMDMALELLSPLSLYSSKPLQMDNKSEQKAEYMRESAKIRAVVELLIGQALTFANIVTPVGRMALTTLCQKVMRECIAFQEECSLSNPDKQVSEQDKQVLAQVLESALLNLDKLLNDMLLETVYELFAKLDQNPIKMLRKMSPLEEDEADQLKIDLEIEKFDNVVDQLMQVGNFAVSYASTPKLKSNLRSCMASCEALDSCLVPSIFSTHSPDHSKLLESHWWEEIVRFRHCIQLIIDSDAFSLNLIDTMTNTIKQLDQKFDLNLMQHTLQLCDVLYEHLQINYTDLKLYNESPAKLYYDDFKLMLNECKAIVQATPCVNSQRIVKRLKILCSVLKKFEKALGPTENGVNKENGVAKEVAFTFGDVSTISRTEDNKVFNVLNITDSLAVAIDLDEFVKSFMDSNASNRNSVFYKSKRKRDRSGRKEMTLPPNLKKNIHTPKRSSKRNSLRVAMFKRQKSMETQKFLDSFTSDSMDTMNLQITDILDQLTDLSETLSKS